MLGPVRHEQEQLGRGDHIGAMKEEFPEDIPRLSGQDHLETRSFEAAG